MDRETARILRSVQRPKKPRFRLKACALLLPALAVAATNFKYLTEDCAKDFCVLLEFICASSRLQYTIAMRWFFLMYDYDVWVNVLFEIVQLTEDGVWKRKRATSLRNWFQRNLTVNLSQNELDKNVNKCVTDKTGCDGLRSWFFCV